MSFVDENLTLQLERTPRYLSAWLVVLFDGVFVLSSQSLALISVGPLLRVPGVASSSFPAFEKVNRQIRIEEVVNAEVSALSALVLHLEDYFR